MKIASLALPLRSLFVAGRTTPRAASDMRSARATMAARSGCSDMAHIIMCHSMTRRLSGTSSGARVLSRASKLRAFSKRQRKAGKADAVVGASSECTWSHSPPCVLLGPERLVRP